VQLRIPVDEAAIRDTMRAVFSQSAYTKRQPGWLARKFAEVWEWIVEHWPLKGSTRHSDPVLYWTAIGILAALAKRHATGQGSLVNTSLFESGLMWASNHVAGYSVTGAMPPRQGTGHPTLTPYQAFECSDGPLMICPGNDRLWRKFAEVLGHPEWPDEARFKTNVQRAEQRELLLNMIADIMERESRAHWSAKLDAAGVPNGPLNTVPQVLELAQTAALGLFIKPYAESGALFHGLPLSLDGERAGGAERAPKIGEHNGKV